MINELQSDQRMRALFALPGQLSFAASNAVRGASATARHGHDHNLGLLTARLPYTVRTTMLRLSLWLSNVPHRRQSL